MPYDIPLNVRRLAEDFAIDVGLPCISDGFELAVVAVSLCYLNPDLQKNLSARLYPAVSEITGTPLKSGCIRKRINASIESAFTYARGGDPYKHFVKVIRFDKGKPTVGEFLFVGARYVRDHINTVP